jgi:MarR family transcriptional regulator, temperature-dependent positive regulator of motility
MKKGDFGPAYPVPFLLYQALRLWQAHFGAALRPMNLTPAQFGALSYLGTREADAELVSQTTLARALQSDAMTVSQVLRTLERKSLVARVPNPRDSRANAISITEDGADALRAATRIAARARGEFFAPLGADAAAFGAMLASLIESNRGNK